MMGATSRSMRSNQSFTACDCPALAAFSSSAAGCVRMSKPTEPAEPLSQCALRATSAKDSSRAQLLQRRQGASQFVDKSVNNFAIRGIFSGQSGENRRARIVALHSSARRRGFTCRKHVD